MDEPRVRRGIELTTEQWRQVKARAAEQGQTISEYIADRLDNKVSPLRADASVAMARPPDVAGFGHSSPAPKPTRKK